MSGFSVPSLLGRAQFSGQHLAEQREETAWILLRLAHRLNLIVQLVRNGARRFVGLFRVTAAALGGRAQLGGEQLADQREEGAWVLLRLSGEVDLTTDCGQRRIEHCAETGCGRFADSRQWPWHQRRRGCGGNGRMLGWTQGGW